MSRYASDFVDDIEHNSKPEVIAARLASDPFESDNPQREIFARFLMQTDINYIGLSYLLPCTISEASSISTGRQLLTKKQANRLRKCTEIGSFIEQIKQLETA